MGRTGRRGRYQDAVLWVKSGYDNEGTVTVSSPIAIKVRWELSLNIPDTEVIAIVDRAIARDSIMWLGKITNFTDNGTQELMQVVDYQKVPDVKGRSFQQIVKLKRYGGSLPTVS